MKSLDVEVTLNDWQKDKLQHHIEYNETQKTLLKSGKAVIYCTNRFQRALSLFLQTAGGKKDANGLLQFANKTVNYAHKCRYILIILYQVRYVVILH